MNIGSYELLKTERIVIYYLHIKVLFRTTCSMTNRYLIGH